MSHAGIITESTAAGADLKTLTGDVGAAVAGDGANNIDIIGTAAQGLTFTGTPASHQIQGTVADATTTTKGVSSFAAADFDVAAGAVSLEDTVVKSVTTESGALTPSSHSFSIQGGYGIDVTHVGTLITVDGELASDTNQGIASFDEYDFLVSAGDVEITDHDNILYVGKHGNDSADGKTPSSAKLTIAAAVTAAAAGDTVLVYPGTYTETVTHAANNVNVIGMGTRWNVILQQADANVVNYSTYTGIVYENMTIQCTAATTAIATVTGTTGSIEIRKCYTRMVTAAALAAIFQPLVGAITGAGTMTFRHGLIDYLHTGVGDGTSVKTAFSFVNGAVLTLCSVKNITVSNSGTAAVTSVCADFATTGYVNMHDCNVSVTDPNAALVAAIGYISGTASDFEYSNNIIHVDVQANAGYGFYAADTASTSRFFYNHIYVTDNGGTSYAYYVGATSTVISHFDDCIAADNYSGAGTFTRVRSPEDGTLEVIGELRLPYATYPNTTSKIIFGTGNETSIREYWDNQLYFKVDGTDRFYIGAAFFQAASHGGRLSSNGGISTPDLSFADDANSGLYYISADKFGIGAGGYQAGQVEEVSNIAWATFFNHLDFDGISSGYTGSQNVMRQAGVQTTDAVATQIAAITIASNYMVTVEARFNGLKSDYSAACGGYLQYTARNAGAGAIEVSAPNIVVDEDSAGAPTVGADVNGNDVRLLVTGVAAETWNWVVTYNYNFLSTNA